MWGTSMRDWRKKQNTFINCVFIGLQANSTLTTMVNSIQVHEWLVDFPGIAAVLFHRNMNVPSNVRNVLFVLAYSRTFNSVCQIVTENCFLFLHLHHQSLGQNYSWENHFVKPVPELKKTKVWIVSIEYPFRSRKPAHSALILLTWSFRKNSNSALIDHCCGASVNCQVPVPTLSNFPCNSRQGTGYKQFPG